MVRRMSEEEALRFTRLGCQGDISKLDAEGKRLLWRAGDLRARLMLNDMGLREYNAGNFGGCCTLIHAERYLADRLAYELHPWPKGMVKDESVNPLPERCPHCERLIVEADWCAECEKPFCSLNCTLDHKHPTELQNSRETR